MGGAVSAGSDNDDLIDNLIQADYIKSQDVEKIFRAVDRADYYLEGCKENAYRDLAWKHGHMHLSAPCIYSEVMETLQLKPGMSFLNLGSGTGYLSTMAGLLLGTYGINHGIELYEDVVTYARMKLEDFQGSHPSLDKYEFCPPSFVVGNCLLLDSSVPQYDRVYCGASCPPEHENYIKNLIRVGGILVMPLNDHLLKVTRTSETTYEVKNVLPVSFASLIQPDPKEPCFAVKLPEAQPMALQELCRSAIRIILRRKVEFENPSLLDRKRVVKTKRKRTKRHIKRIVIPLFENRSDEDESDNPIPRNEMSLDDPEDADMREIDDKDDNNNVSNEPEDLPSTSNSRRLTPCTQYIFYSHPQTKFFVSFANMTRGVRSEVADKVDDDIDDDAMYDDVASSYDDTASAYDEAASAYEEATAAFKRAAAISEDGSKAANKEDEMDSVKMEDSGKPDDFTTENDEGKMKVEKPLEEDSSSKYSKKWSLPNDNGMVQYHQEAKEVKLPESVGVLTSEASTEEMASKIHEDLEEDVQEGCSKILKNRNHLDSGVGNLSDDSFEEESIDKLTVRNEAADDKRNGKKAKVSTKRSAEEDPDIDDLKNSEATSSPSKQARNSEVVYKRVTYSDGESDDFEEVDSDSGTDQSAPPQPKSIGDLSNYTVFMKQKIELLPLPQGIKDYLHFYRQV